MTGLVRRLGLGDTVVVGLGAMIGAGVFSAFAPAAAAAGSGLLVGLAIAALVAYCNATSSARLAALYPTSGGTYVYGRERLGPFWGYLAGWSFVVGKTASCAAMALTVGLHVWPERAHLVAVAAVVLLTALNYVGVKKAARVIVATVLVVLAVVVVTGLGSSAVDLGNLGVAGGFGVLEAAGLLFFAFAGYARVATLGEEVRDPVRTIPRAISIALVITLFVYAAVGVTVLSVLGPARLAESKAPLVDVVVAAGVPGLAPVVTVGAALAALGALLALILGVSRTVLAMARDRHLPGALAVVHPRFSVPHRAELVVGAVVAIAAGFADLRGVIGFSSFGVLLYYAIANASAWTLGSRRVVPVVGLLGCVVLACTLPVVSVLSGAAVVVVGIVLYAVR
ncbi:amino acid/polyamine/organocation transporter, APC superfamily [Allokutzneria albata]|uniref:Amino acid/polyamine/organocation transporter, APC superfamily n=2 Tax=Allokutzneria albata TaxID=211114 RepID=A0A1G9TM82_ALLAB|nr:amino acid/polyamine/organocation transporter, APC superfamily [Allokutzneria albata]